MTAYPGNLEQILSDDGFVRRLAKSLIRDEHDADDIAQSAWLAALTHRPAGEHRSWFAVVLQNLARSRAREGAQREHRERAAAREERIPSVEDLAEREATRRHVVDHVMRLDESYRTVILLRFFEDWSPRRIASELGVPVETVKTRQKRALEKLRRTLDEQSHGDRAAWCLQLLPLAHAKASAATTITGALLMATKAKLVIAAVLVVAAGVALRTAWVSPPTTLPSHEVTAGAERAQTPDSAKLAESAGEESTARKEAELGAPTRSASSAPVDPVGLIVFGTVRDRSGKALADIYLRFDDADGNQLSSRTQADGVFSLHGLSPAKWHLRCSAVGFLTHDADVDLTSKSGAQRLDVVLDPSPLIAVRIVAPDGSPIESALPFGTFRLTSTNDLAVVATTRSVAPRLPLSNMTHRGESDCGSFLVRSVAKQRFPELELADGVRGILALSRPPPVFVSLLLSHVVLAEQAVTAGTNEIVFTISPQAFRAALANLRFQVVDAEKRTPIAGAPVSLNSKNTWEGAGSKTAHDGRLSLEAELPGLRELWIHAEGYANLSQHVRLEPGETVDLGVLELHRQAKLTGRVVDEQGRPQSVSFLFRNVAREPLPEPLTTVWMHGGSDDKGDFSAHLLEPGRYLLLPNDDSKAWALEPTWIDVGADPNPEVRIVVRPGVEVTLRPQLDSESESLVVVENERGTAIFSEYIASDRPEHLRLAPGSYTWKVLVDDRPLRVQAFTVGSTPVTITVSR